MGNEIELKNKAIELINKKDFVNSIDILKKLLSQKPDSIEILNYIALCYSNLKKYHEALKSFEKIIDIKNDLPEIHYNIAQCHFHLSNQTRSLDSYYTAIKIKPNFYEAYLQAGNILKDSMKYQDSINLYLDGLKNCDQKEVFFINLSEIYFLMQNYNNSKKYAEKAIKIDNNNYRGYLNLAINLLELEDAHGAIHNLNLAKNINPKIPSIYNNLGVAYRYLGDKAKALKNYHAAINLDQKNYDAFYNLSLVLLSNNNFKNGWRNYEYRLLKKDSPLRYIKFKKPIWNKNLGYKRILLWGEQGIGEQIIFSSMIKDAINDFDEVTILINTKLLKIFSDSFPNAKVIDTSSQLSEDMFDYHFPLCSLGLIYRQELEDFTDKEVKLNFNAPSIIQKSAKLKCCLSWKSLNKKTGNSRSVSLENLKDIISINEIDFYDIQYSNENEEIKKFENKYNFQIKKIGNIDKYNDIYSLLRFIRSCSFVISISNTNVHLSSSIGVPTLMLLPKLDMGTTFYWSNTKEGKNVWYPSLKIFQQSKMNSWEEPILEMKDYIIENYL